MAQWSTRRNFVASVYRANEHHRRISQRRAVPWGVLAASYWLRVCGCGTPSSQLAPHSPLSPLTSSYRPASRSSSRRYRRWRWYVVVRRSTWSWRRSCCSTPAGRLRRRLSTTVTVSTNTRLASTPPRPPMTKCARATSKHGSWSLERTTARRRRRLVFRALHSLEWLTITSASVSINSSFETIINQWTKVS